MILCGNRADNRKPRQTRCIGLAGIARTGYDREYFWVSRGLYASAEIYYEIFL